MKPSRLPLAGMLLMLLGVGVSAQPAPAPERFLTAIRIEDSEIDVDGRLDEVVWARASPTEGFTQRDPVDGAPASERTEVRVLFSPAALYVGVRAFDSDPAAIVGRLARRDDFQQSDGIIVFLDSFHDRRTAFQFGVTPRGSIMDRYSTNDNRGGDASWDPVWQVATSVDDLGWVAEFRIPFTQLRFDTEETTWGFQVHRRIERKNEDLYWAPWSKTAAGFTSLFGELHGLAGLSSPARLEVRPYVVAEGRRRPPSTGQAYAPGSSTKTSAGFDLKYGLTSDFTLDLTANPDFGQVEADPAVVNLTAFESFFQERRPFFVEGAGLFNQFVPAGRMFYSRRIGRSPQGWSDPPTGGTIEIPEASTIVAAAKVTGKSAGGLGLGVLSAMTSGESGTLRDSTDTVVGSAPVQPWVHHFMARVEQDLKQGQHTFGAMVTALNRFDGADNFGLRRAAYSMKVDGRHQWQRNTYALEWSIAASHIRGTEDVILAAQRSSARYFQRPDADHVSVDSTRTSLGGYSFGLNFGKNAGTWRYYGWASRTTPEFDVADMGFANGSMDYQGIGGGVQYYRSSPLGPFRDFGIWTESNSSWTNGWERLTTWVRPVFVHANLRSNWSFDVNPIAVEFAGRSIEALRGGPSLRLSDWRNSFIDISSDPRRRLAFSFGGNLGGRFGSPERFGSVYLNTTVRPSSTLTARLNVRYAWTDDPEQWVGRRTVGGTTRYALGFIEQRTLNTNVRADWTISPNLSFQLYAQPFTSAGAYTAYMEVADPNADDRDDRFYSYGNQVTCGPSSCDIDRDSDGTVDASFPRPDFNVKSLRMTSVLRWEYVPGSVLYVAWQHGRSEQLADGRFDGLNALSDLLGLPSDNTLLVKVSYWLGL